MPQEKEEAAWGNGDSGLTGAASEKEGNPGPGDPETLCSSFGLQMRVDGASGSGFAFQSFGGTRGFLCFADKNGMEPGSSSSLKLGTPLIKTFFPPQQSLFYGYVLEQVTESHFTL